MTRAIALLLLLAACADEPKVVTRTVYTLPTPPSADLLAPLVPVTTAGSANAKEVVERLTIGNKVRDDLIKGWRDWWAAAQESAARAAGGR